MNAAPDGPGEDRLEGQPNHKQQTADEMADLAHTTANRRSVGTSAPTPYIGGRRNECLELIRQTCENACWWRLKPVSQPTRLRKSSWLAAPRSTAGWRRLMTKAAVRPSRWGAARNRSSAMRPRWRCAACWRRTIT